MRIHVEREDDGVVGGGKRVRFHRLREHNAGQAEPLKMCARLICQHRRLLEADYLATEPYQLDEIAAGAAPDQEHPVGRAQDIAVDPGFPVFQSGRHTALRGAVRLPSNDARLSKLLEGEQSRTEIQAPGAPTRRAVRTPERAVETRGHLTGRCGALSHGRRTRWRPPTPKRERRIR